MFLCVEVALREASSEEAGVRFQNKAHLNNANIPFKCYALFFMLYLPVTQCQIDLDSPYAVC